MMDEKYFCGIDVSKENFSVAVKNHQFLVDRQKFSMDRAGFEKLNALLSPYQEKILVGMESTGIYHTNLFYFLGQAGYNTTVANPYKVRQFFKFVSDKPTKTDNKDARVICQFVQYHTQENQQFHHKD